MCPGRERDAARDDSDLHDRADLPHSRRASAEQLVE
jgi:hypothetical protein